MTKEQFGQLIKQKYPQYRNMSDLDVANTTLAKYPQYRSQITEVEPEKKKKGFGRKVLDFFTASEQAFGETLGTAAAVLTGKSKEINEAAIAEADSRLRLAKQLRNASPVQTRRIMSQLSSGQNVAMASEQLPAIRKSSKQIYGEGLGVLMDIVAFGKFGKALPITKATTAKQAFKMGAKKFGIEGATIGTGFGVSGALQEDEPIGKVVGAGLTGALTGGIIGSITGGLMARKRFKTVGKVKKLRQKAVEQYQRGLNATKEKMKEKAEKIIPELLDNEVWGTHKKLMAKAETGISLSEKEYQQLGKLKGYADIKGIQNMIDDEIAKFTLESGRVSFINKPKVKALDNLKADLLAVDAFDKIKDSKAGQQKLRELAQQYGGEVYETRRAQKTIMDNKTLSQVKKVDSAIRDLLNKDPHNIKYAKINETFHLNSELAEILSETAFRKGGHKWLNMIRSLSFGGGAVTGAVVGGAPGVVVGGLSLGILTEIINSTWWNTMKAVQKNRLADKLMQKSVQELNQALILLSRQGIKAVQDILND